MVLSNGNALRLQRTASGVSWIEEATATFGAESAAPAVAEMPTWDDWS